jgi:thymidylate synthase
MTDQRVTLDKLRTIASTYNDYAVINSHHSSFNPGWLMLAAKILIEGSVDSADSERTGTGTISLFGQIGFSHDLANCFPLLGLKHVSFKQIKAEILWMLRGLTNINELKALGGGNIWDQWADDTGELGPVYGKQWRNWEDNSRGNRIDQIAELQRNLIDKPFSRRHVVSCWNVSELANDKIKPNENPKNGKMALSPCHHQFQVKIIKLTPNEAVSRYCELNGTDHFSKNMTIPLHRLDLQLNMRSNDWFLGSPYNIAGYALLTHLLAMYTGCQPGKLHYTVGDAHIYLNHLEQFGELFRRAAPAPVYIKPKLVLEGHEKKDIWSYEPREINVVDYVHEGILPGPVAV